MSDFRNILRKINVPQTFVYISFCSVTISKFITSSLKFFNVTSCNDNFCPPAQTFFRNCISNPTTPSSYYNRFSSQNLKWFHQLYININIMNKTPSDFSQNISEITHFVLSFLKRKFLTESDITLGDFWGLDASLDDDRGTSMIMVNSEKGERLLCEASKRLNTCFPSSNSIRVHHGDFFQPNFLCLNHILDTFLL